MNNQLGCQHCGVVLHRRDAEARMHDERLMYACPECGAPMQAMGVREALDLSHERDEAMRWRAARERPAAGRAHR